MITPSFGLTATERVLPRMALDFTTASLDSRVTFTRTGNTATVTNSSGYVVGINADLPRFDFDPSTLVCKGLLIEEARTNLLTYSQDLTNAAWVYDGNILTVSSNAAIAPDGVATAEKITPKAVSSAFKELQQNVSFIAGQNYAFSVFFKADGYDLIQIYGSGTQLGTFAINYNLSSGVETNFIAGTSTIISRAINSFGNGWYRISVVATCLFTGSGRFAFSPIPATNSIRGVTWTPNGTSSFLAWGTQIELGAFPTSYIPTEATTVTRNADVATMTGANFSDWYTSTQGTWYSETQPIPLSTAVGNDFPRIVNNLSNNVTPLCVNSTGKGIAFNGSTLLTTANSILSSGISKLACSFNAAGFSIALNSGTVVTTASTMPTYTGICIGRQPDNFNNINSVIKKMFFYQVKFTNAELAAFTKL